MAKGALYNVIINLFYTVKIKQFDQHATLAALPNKPSSMSIQMDE